jgi:cobalt-zinc-cadmium efflux system outer membrane protein
VAEAAVAQALERPNPDLTFEKEKETPLETATLSLPFETAGKRRLRADVARAEMRSGENELLQLQAEVRNRVRRAYYELIATRRRETEQRESLGLAGRIRDAASERFEAGEAPRLELLQAQLAADQAETEASVAGGSSAAATATLNSLIGRPPDQRLDLAGDLDAGPVPEAGLAIDLALGSSAELALFDRRIEEARARADLARAQRVPDLTLDAGVTHDSEPEFTWGWRAGVTVTLPVFTTHRSAVLIEERTLERIRAEREAAAVRIRGEVFAAIALTGARGGQARRYRDEILPRANEIQGMAEEAYRAGETGLVAMLQSFQITQQVRREAIQAGLDYQSALADLEQAIGAPLP